MNEKKRKAVNIYLIVLDVELKKYLIEKMLINAGLNEF